MTIQVKKNRGIFFDYHKLTRNCYPMARVCYYNVRLIHEHVENLKLQIAVVSTDHLQIYFLSSQDMQIITSDNICIGRINQSKTFL